MELSHSFTVPASVEDTWAAFTNLEMVAGCFPGASLASVEGDDFTGTCKVKLGPISLLYAGAGSFLERDDSAHRFVIEAKGKDKRGNGTAGATVTAVLTSTGTETTNAEVVTDLSITGKPAQFGRGVIQDVSDKLLQQFVACLEAKVTAPAAEPEAPAAPAPEVKPAPPVAEEAPAAPAVEEAGAGVRKAATTAYAGVSAGGEPGAQPWEPPPGAGAHRAVDETEALDLGATLLPILLRSYWKQIAGGILVLLVLWRLLRRRRS